jgi:hypothetical protein
VDELPEFSPVELLRRLVAGSVDFVVVGGVAATAHGSVAFTQDLDISYAPDSDNLGRLGDVLVSIGARLRGVTDDVPFVPEGRTLRRTRVLTERPYTSGCVRARSSRTWAASRSGWRRSKT